MQIDWNQSAHGYTLSQIRALMKIVISNRPGGFGPEDLLIWMTTWPPEMDRPAVAPTPTLANSILNALAASRLVEPAYGADWRFVPGKYMATDLALSFLRSMPVRYSRAEADAAVTGVLDRVRMIEADQALLYGVKRLAIYGSYLGKSETVGDVDIAYELEPRFSGEPDFAATMRFLDEHPVPDDLEDRGTDEWAAWATLRLLADRDNVYGDGLVQISKWEDIVRLGSPMRQIHPHLEEFPGNGIPPYREEVILRPGTRRQLVSLNRRRSAPPAPLLHPRHKLRMKLEMPDEYRR